MTGVWVRPVEHSGVGVLTLAGSSGRVDEERARLFARHGALAGSIRWFGGVGQRAGPWEIPLEVFQERVGWLRRSCDRVVVVGTSFGAEAALVTGAHAEGVDAVVAFAPSDVVWAGVRDDGTQTSHWTVAGRPLPFVPFLDGWEPDGDPPAYRRLYESSRAADPAAVEAAAIPVERIPEVMVVAGQADLVWPSVLHARAIARRRRRHGLATTVVVDPAAGHRAVLPGEAAIACGVRMARGGSEAADRRMGAAAWENILPMIGVRAGQSRESTPYD